MEIIKSLMSLLLQLDSHLFSMIQNYGLWIYVILFLIIFIETGIVLMPFLPGDSLLFVAGTFCAGVTNSLGEKAELNLWIVLSLLMIAAIVGDSVNYFFGKTLGLKVLTWKIRGRQIVKQKYIDQTHAFYEKHGPKTIIIARFVPIVRTFAPFVAGVGSMNYKRFIRFNIIGGCFWVTSLVLLGYFFGNLTFVQNNFEFVIFGIIGLSLLPMVIEMVRAPKKRILN
ncbi:MAG: membrane-associated protein [Bacteroidetes bacterium]|nr:MAG: membrane-associated protein [Bacteroidota bacterium]